MKKTIKFIAAALIFALALSVFMTAAFAGETETETITEATEATEATGPSQSAEPTALPRESQEATEATGPSQSAEPTALPGESQEATEEDQSLWDKFWTAIISMINGTNARDAVVTVCSLLGAVLMVFARGLVHQLQNKMAGFTATNGAKVNELIKGFNENSEQIAELESKFEEKFGEIYDKCVVAADKTSEKDARVEVTNDAVLALAGMLATIYTSSTTIPDAAKEIIREKYAGVLHAVNKISETSERLTEESDIIKAE